MKMLTRLEKFTTKNYILTLFCTSTVLAVLLITALFGQLELKPDATMDSLFFYSADTFYFNLTWQSQPGRDSYLLLHLIDYIFITQFYLVLAGFSLRIFRKTGIKKKYEILALIPFLAASMDYLENICIDLAILFFPKRISILGTLSGYFTLLKMLSLLVVVLIFSFIMISYIRKRVRNRNNIE
jgi:hypothetical protein